MSALDPGAADDVVYGARWVVAAETRIALCRTDLRAGTCARLYFEAVDARAYPGARLSVGLVDDNGPCRAGALRARARGLEAIDGTASWGGPADPIGFAFDARFEDGSILRFEGETEMGQGRCP